MLKVEVEPKTPAPLGSQRLFVGPSGSLYYKTNDGTFLCLHVSHKSLSGYREEGHVYPNVTVKPFTGKVTLTQE